MDISSRKTQWKTFCLTPPYFIAPNVLVFLLPTGTIRSPWMSAVPGEAVRVARWSGVDDSQFLQLGVSTASHEIVICVGQLLELQI
jgi:hypothetical protein